MGAEAARQRRPNPHELAELVGMIKSGTFMSLGFPDGQVDHRWRRHGKDKRRNSFFRLMGG